MIRYMQLITGQLYAVRSAADEGAYPSVNSERRKDGLLELDTQCVYCNRPTADHDQEQRIWRPPHRLSRVRRPHWGWTACLSQVRQPPMCESRAPFFGNLGRQHEGLCREASQSGLLRWNVYPWSQADRRQCELGDGGKVEEASVQTMHGRQGARCLSQISWDSPRRAHVCHAQEGAETTRTERAQASPDSLQARA